MARETAVRSGTLDTLRGALAGRSAVLEEAGQVESRAAKSIYSIGGNVGVVLADQAEALWMTLDEGLHDWQAASVDQEERLLALKGETRFERVVSLSYHDIASTVALVPLSVPWTGSRSEPIIVLQTCH